MADRSIQGIAVEIRGDYRKLQADMRAASKEVRASAEGMSAALNNALSPRQIETGIMSLTKNLRSIKGATSLAGSEFKNIGVDLAAMRSQIGLSEKSFANLQSRILQTRAGNINDRAIVNIAKSANLGALATAKLQRELGDTAGAFRTLSSGGVAAFRRISASVLSFKSLLAGVAIGSSMKSVFEAGRSYAALNRSLDAISGSSSETQKQLSYLQRTADNLGQNFFDLADSYKSYYAAAKQANMETATAQRIFTAFTQAGAVQGLSAEKMKYVFMAVEQMTSKGTVSMEELRRQLGDNLPGALGIAAEAMGVTIKELIKMVSNGEVLSADLLPKMAKILETRFTGGVDKATAAQNKFTEAWQKAKLKIAESGFLDSAVKSMKEITTYLGSQSAQENLTKLADGMGAIAIGASKTAVALGKVAGILSSLPPEALGALGGAAVGYKLGKGPGALVGGVVGGFSGDLYDQYELSAKVKASVIARLQREQRQRELQAKDAEIMNNGNGVYRGGYLVGPNAQVDLAAEWQAANPGGKAVTDPKVTAAREALAQLRREIQIIVATQSGSSTSALLGIDDAYLQRVAKVKADITDSKTLDSVKTVLRQQLDAEKEKYGIEREYATKRIQLEEEVKSASLRERLAELNGVDAYEAKKAAIVAKYAQIRLRGQSPEAQAADAMQAAEIGKMDRERAATLAQQRAEYAKLTYNSKAYYQAMLDEIQAGITGNETIRQKLILQKQMADIQARIDGNGWYAAQEGLNEFADSATDNFDAIKDYARSTADSMTDFFLGATDDIGTAFENMATSALKDIARIMIQSNISAPIASGISGLIGDMFGGGGAAEISLVGKALGGTFSGPGISAYSSSVVSRPTVFPFAQGIGLMGEDGAEAIMPLTKNSSGALVGDATGLGGTNNYTAHITFSVMAMDASSFRTQLVQNKQAVVGIVNQAFTEMGKRGPQDRGR